jgi:hypothetical protein
MVGLGQHPHSPREVAGLPGIDNRNGKAAGLEGTGEGMLVAPSGLHHDQLRLESLQLGDEIGVALGLVLKASEHATRIHRGNIEVCLGDVYANDNR